MRGLLRGERDILPTLTQIYKEHDQIQYRLVRSNENPQAREPLSDEIADKYGLLVDDLPPMKIETVEFFDDPI